MARVLIANNIRCTLVIKPSDMMHFAMRFDDTSLITVVQLDYTKEECRDQLIFAAQSTKYIYLILSTETFFAETLPRIAQCTYCSTFKQSTSILCRKNLSGRQNQTDYQGFIICAKKRPDRTRKNPYKNRGDDFFYDEQRILSCLYN